MGVRHIQCVFLFLTISIAYTLRCNLYVAILAMTDKTYANEDIRDYDWSEKTKSVVLSSFYWGYSITQIPGGFFSVLYGGKIVLSIGIIASSTMALLLPTCADIGGWQLVCAVRMIDGMSQGVIFPSAYAVLGNWSPIEERGLLGAFSFSGIQFGTFISTIFSGFIAASFLGWPFVFYIPGAFGILLIVCFSFLGASSPSECKYVSAEEKEYISASIAKISSDGESRKNLKVPWLKIFTSVPLYGVIAAQCSNLWGLVTLNTQIPNYFKNILHFDIKSNGTLASLPWLLMLILGNIFGAIATLMEKKYGVSTWTCRRVANCVGELTPAAGLIALAFVGDEHINLAVAIVIISVGINSAVFISYSLSHIDLSPNFAGTVMGIANSIGNMMGFLAPLFVGAVVTDVTDPTLWRIVFFFASGYYFIGNLIYVIFGSATVQPWNESRRASIPPQQKAVEK